MRLFEAALLIVDLNLLLGLVLPITPKRQGLWIAAGILILFPLHLIIEGYRWQMIGVYGLAAALLLWYLRQQTRSDVTTPSRKVTVPIVAAGLLVAALSAALLTLFPVPTLPDPAGPHDIGTITFHWVDGTRPGIYTKGPDAARQLMVQIWYPAQPVRGIEPEPWLEYPGVTAPSLAEWGELPRFLLRHLNLVKTHTFQNVPLLEKTDPYPVILYSHGWGGFRNINQDQIEALVSEGYLVVAADHTYGSLDTTFPDGHVAYLNPEALPEGVPDEEYDRASQKLVDTYAGDLIFVLDRLETLNQGTPDTLLAGKLDLEGVGLFGHSTGGGAVIEVCAIDPRCWAVLGQDAWVKPVSDEILEASLEQPLALVNSEAWNSPGNAARQRTLYNGLSSRGYWIEIGGTSHYDFVLVPFLSPITHQLGFKGPLPSERVGVINAAILTTFFDNYLKGIDIPSLADSLAELPELQVEFHEPGD